MTKDDLVVTALAAWNGVPPDQMRTSLTDAQRSPISMYSWGRVVDAVLGAFVAEVERRAIEHLSQDHRNGGYLAAMKAVLAEGKGS